MCWKRLTVEDRDIIQKYLKGRFNTSDLNFSNLLLWSKSENIEFIIEDEVLVIKGCYEGNEYFFPPVSIDNSTTKIKESIKKIRESRGDILFIPEFYADFLKDEFNLIENRDSFDYLYLQKDLAELKGRKFTSKKNKINKFKKAYNYTYESISEKNIEEVREFQREWIKTREDNIVIAESLGIELLLDNYTSLELKGGVIRVDGKIIAYAFGEKLNSEIAVIHIEKGISEYQGCYQMINMYVAKEEFSDVLYINREDDFGIEGLRIAKLSYCPIELLKKYSIKEDFNV